MEINIRGLKRVSVVEIRGRLDHQSFEDLDRVLNQLLSAGKYNIVVDLSGVDYISSAGLRTMMIARKATQGKGDLRLASPQALVSETLKMVGFDHVFGIFPDLVDAVGSF